MVVDYFYLRKVISQTFGASWSEFSRIYDKQVLSKAVYNTIMTKPLVYEYIKFISAKTLQDIDMQRSKRASTLVLFAMTLQDCLLDEGGLDPRLFSNFLDANKADFQGNSQEKEMVRCCHALLHAAVAQVDPEKQERFVKIINVMNNYQLNEVRGIGEEVSFKQESKYGFFKGVWLIMITYPYKSLRSSREVNALWYLGTYINHNDEYVDLKEDLEQDQTTIFTINQPQALKYLKTLSKKAHEKISSLSEYTKEKKLEFLNKMGFFSFVLSESVNLHNKHKYFPSRLSPDNNLVKIFSLALATMFSLSKVREYFDT